MSWASHNFVGMRLMSVSVMPVLMGLAYWEPLLGPVLSVVWCWWFVRIGVPVAGAWATTQTRGLSRRRGASEARWPAAFGALISGAALALGVYVVLRYLTPVGDWLESPALGTAAPAALVLLMSSVPGVVVVRRRAVRFRQETTAAEEKGSPARAQRPLGRPHWLTFAAVALLLSAANLAFMSQLLPLGSWLEAGGSPRVLAATLVVAIGGFPLVAVWVVWRRAPDPEHSR